VIESLRVTIGELVGGDVEFVDDEVVQHPVVVQQRELDYVAGLARSVGLISPSISPPTPTNTELAGAAAGRQHVLDGHVRRTRAGIARVSGVSARDKPVAAVRIIRKRRSETGEG